MTADPKVILSHLTKIRSQSNACADHAAHLSEIGLPLPEENLVQPLGIPFDRSGTHPRARHVLLSPTFPFSDSHVPAGEVHQRHRKIMNPAFSAARLRSFLPLFQRIASKVSHHKRTDRTVAHSILPTSSLRSGRRSWQTRRNLRPRSWSTDGCRERL